MDMSLAVIILIIAIFTFFIPALSKKAASGLWRVVYLAPLLLSIMLSMLIEWDAGYMGVYLAAVLIMTELFFEKHLYRNIISGMAIVSVTVTIVYMAVSPMYHRTDYLADFKYGFNTMKEHYVLTEEKGIDWDALYEKYEPRFAEASREQDVYLCNKLWTEFAQEFYDGHVAYCPADDREAEALYAGLFGNDYGMSMLRLSDGRYVAVNVEGCGNSYTITDPGEEYDFVDEYMSGTAMEDRLQLYDAGIHNGSVITSWNGRPVEESFDQVEAYINSYPDRRNEEFYLPVYAAGMGSESVDISFIDDSGNEKTVSAKSLGSYYPRLLTTINTLDEGVNISNLDWMMADSETAVLRIDQMAYDMETYDGADYSEMTEELKGMISTLKESDVDRLIIDLRMNGGGSPFMVASMVSLFAPEGEHVLSYTAVINEKTASFDRGPDGKYIKGEPVTYTGEALWAGRDIILLVNAETISAGDMMTYTMAAYPNVTVMGFTGSDSSCQAVSSISLKQGTLSYSAVPDLDENGDPIIDTCTDHVSRVPVDHFVPLTEEAVIAIFDEGEDYLLEYACEY